jgi:subtilisin family serine protease
MIDTGTFARGVSPMAELPSIGLGFSSPDPDTALALNRLAATIGGGAISAINISFGQSINFGLLEKDGKSHFTQFVDWSARQHDVVYAVAWTNNDQPDEFTKPQDNFNGITVAASEPDDDLKYYRVSSGNIADSDLTDQYSIDILAPGDLVLKLGWGGVPNYESGSSIATPHVTGAVALVQQYAQKQNFGNSGSGAGSAAGVPEPFGVILIDAGIVLAVNSRWRPRLKNSLRSSSPAEFPNPDLHNNLCRNLMLVTPPS